MLRKLLLIGGAAVLTCLLLIYGVLAGFILGSARDAAVHAVLRAVSNILPGSLEVGQVQGSLLSTFVIQDIVIKDAQNTVIGRIAALGVSYNPFSLLRLRLTVHEIDIAQPQFTLVEEPDGALNISRAFAAARPRQPKTSKPPVTSLGLPFAIVVEDVRLHQGEVTLALPALPGVNQVTGLQLRAAAQLDAQGIQTHIQHLTATTDPAHVNLHTLHGTFAWRAGAMRFDALRLEMGQTVLMANGALPHVQQPADFTLHIEPLDIAEIGRLLRQESLRGQVRLQMGMQGPPEALVANLEINPLGEDAKGAVLVAGEVDLQAAPLRYRAQVDVAHLDLTAVLNRPAWASDLNLQVHVAGEGLAPRDLQCNVRVDVQRSHLGNIGLQPSQIDLQAQQGRFQVRRFEVNTTLARMHATGAVDLSGRSDLVYELSADLSNLRQLLDEAHLSGDVHLQGQATGEWPHLTVGGALDVHQVQYRTYALESLRLTYEGADLGAAPQATTELTLRRARLGAVPLTQVELRGAYDGAARQVQFTVNADQAAGNGLYAAGKLTLQEAAQQVDIETLRLQLAERVWQAAAPLSVIHGADRLQFTTVRLEHADESIEISGGLAGETFEDIRVQASHIDLSLAQQVLTLPAPVQGRASFQLLLSGTRPAPLLQVDLSLRSEARQELPFQGLHASLAYAQQLLQGQVRLQQVDREVLTIDLHLPVDMALTALPLEQRLIEGPIALDVQLRQPELAAFTRWLPGSMPLAGTLQGTFGVQGTAAQLGLKADLHLQKLGIAGVTEEIEGALGMTGQLVAAASIPALQQAIQRGDPTVSVDGLVLRSPHIRGHWLARDKPAQPFTLQDLLLQAHGAWSAQGGYSAMLQTLRLQATAFGLPRTDLLLEAGLTPTRLDLQTLRVRLPHSELRGRGRLSMADQQLQFRLEIPHLQLDEFPVSLPPDLPKQMQGVITANGSLKAPRAEVRLTYAGVEIDADLEAQLQERLTRYQIKLRLDAPDISRISPKLAGGVQATLQLQGQGFTEEQRQASVNLAVDSRNLSLAPGLTLRLQGQLAGETVRLQTLRLSSAPLQLTASGTLSATRDAGVSYALILGDLAPLQALLGATVQASGTLTGKVRGPLHALQTTGALRLKNWHYAAFSGGAVEADFAAAQLPSAPQGRVKVRVSDVEGPSLPATSLQVEADYTPPQGRVNATVTKGPYQHTTLAGRVALNGGQRLTLERLRLQLRELAWNNEGPIELVRTAQGDLDIRRVNLRSGPQRLNVRGRVAQGGAIAADVQVRQVQIGPNVRAVMPNASVPEGQLSLDMTLAGTLQQPQGKGTLQITSLAWQERKLGEMRATVELANQTAHTDLRWRVQDRDLLQVQGRVGLAAAGALAMQVRAPNLPVDMFSGIVPGVIHSEGTLNLDLQVGGNLQQPLLNGALTLDQGALQLTVTGERYQNIRLRIVLAGDRIDIQELHVGTQTGPLEVSGWARLAGVTLQQVDITVRAREFTAMNTPGIQALTSMDLVVRGSQQDMTVTGTVTVPRVRVQLNKVPGTGPRVVQDWELTVEGVYGPGPQAAGGETDAGGVPMRIDVPLPFLRADIRVDIPRNAWVQGPGTAIEMSGDLHITKELAQPFVLSGEINIVHGFASMYGKRFVIRQGQVIFTGSPEINPQLDITVTHTVSGYVVAIQVEGRAREPHINFSSTPDLSQTDILSLLIVGKTADRLTSSEQQNFSSRLAGTAGSMVAGQLQEVLGGMLGLDMLSIGTGENVRGDSISIGHYVTQDIFLSYEVGMSKGGGNRVGVEYSVTPRLKLKGSTSDNGASAVDFLWRCDY